MHNIKSRSYFGIVKSKFHSHRVIQAMVCVLETTQSKLETEWLRNFLMTALEQLRPFIALQWLALN